MIKLVSFKLAFRSEPIWSNPDHVRSVHRRAGVAGQSCIRMAGVPDDLASCHTARVGGYVLEGHVPAEDVKRLLAERPQARGLAVPGMPQDAPGMDMGVGQPYQVMLFGAAGGPQVFARH